MRLFIEFCIEFDKHLDELRNSSEQVGLYYDLDKTFCSIKLNLILLIKLRESLLQIFLKLIVNRYITQKIIYKGVSQDTKSFNKADFNKDRLQGILCKAIFENILINFVFKRHLNETIECFNINFVKRNTSQYKCCYLCH